MADDGGGRGRVVKDPVYGYIFVPDRLSKVLDHPLVQRLRRISQNSLASFVYPSLTGKRFEHSLGVMHLAMEAWRHAWRNADKDTQNAFRDWVAADRSVAFPRDKDLPFDRSIQLAMGCVGLLHDIGHTPYSHALEPLYQLEASRIFAHNQDVLKNYDTSSPYFHTFAGSRLAPIVMTRLKPDELAAVATRIYMTPPGSNDWASTLHGVIAGEVDVDRLDYLMRDAMRSASEYGAIDHIRLLQALELMQQGDGKFVIAPGARARAAAETLLVQRTQAYRWIYFHPRVVGTDLALLRAVQSLFLLCQGRQPLRDLRAATIGSIFEQLVPTLDYIDPAVTRQADFGIPVADRVEAVEGAERDRDLFMSLIAELEGMLDEGLKDIMRASVDDSTILEWLKRGRLVSAVISTLAKVDRDVPALKRFDVYYDAAVNRQKNFVPAWKSHEEYLDVAEELQATLQERVASAYEQLLADISPTRPGWVTSVMVVRDRVLSLMGGNPAAALNAVAGRMLWKDASPLAQHLNRVKSTPEPTIRGFWDAAYRRFSSLDSESSTQTLLVRERRDPVALTRTSPLVRSLTDVDREHMKLFTYYFVLGYNETEDFDTYGFRESLRDGFVAAFPDFVSTYFIRAERERLWQPGTEGAN